MQTADTHTSRTGQRLRTFASSGLLRLGFVWVTALALAVKLPYALGPFRLYSDAIAYANIAHNWASGRGFVSTLRLNYFDSAPVTHFALADWPPLYPFFAGIVIKLGASDAWLQVVNAVLAALAAGLVFILTDRLFGRRAAFVAGVTAALALNLFRSSLTALSDPLGVTLALGALCVANGAEGRPGRWLAAGALAAAAYLTRFPNLVLMIAFVGYAFVRRDKQAAWCIAGFALVAGPVLAWKWALYGSPLYGVQAMHYSTASFRDSSWQWHQTAPGPSRAPVGDISAAIVRNALYFLASLSVAREGLGTLLAGLPLACIAHGRTVYARDRGLALAVAAGTLGVYSLTWSLPAAQGARFMLLPYCLLLPFAAAGIVWLFQRGRIWSRLLAPALVIAVVLSYHANYGLSARWAAQFQPLETRAVNGVVRLLPPGTIVASNNPWLVSYQTGLPTTALPHNLDRNTLPRFIGKYHVGALVVLKAGRHSQTRATIAEHEEWFKKHDVGEVSVAIPGPTSF